MNTVKRGRGRPKGSKNKPKNDVVPVEAKEQDEVETVEEVEEVDQDEDVDTENVDKEDEG